MRSGLAAVLAVGALAVGACGGDETASTTITVFAASSLQGTFTELADRFEDENPGWTVELSFAGSADLVTQINEGAPADVFASADRRTMAQLDPADLATPAEPFATNTMTIAVAPGNPAGIDSLDDLAAPDVAVVVCAPQVPCGTAAQTVEAAAGIDITPVSEESAVTDVLGKVSSGEADAGIVYVTDVEAAGDAVESVEIDRAVNAVTTYPIAALASSDDAEVARAFVDFVLGRAGRAVLGAAGFGAP